MCDNSRETIIAKYTDKSRYNPKYIFGDVYVDEDRIKKLTSDQAKEVFDRELKAAKRFSKHFNCDVFILPEGDANGNVIYVEKHKNPDAIIQGYFIDFKQAKGTDSSVTKKLGKGLSQSDGIIITIEDELSIMKAVQWINGKLNSLESEYNGFIVIIEDYIGNYSIFTVNEKRLSAEENLFTAAQRLLPSNPESKNPQVDLNIPQP